jgi:hypothetical protein
MSNVVSLSTIRAKFQYFSRIGKFHSIAFGHMRHGWETLPNCPRLRRDQIIQDNRGVMPGDVSGRASDYFIHIIAYNKQTLVLPETPHHQQEKNNGTTP